MVTLGVDLGGTDIKSVAVSPAGQVLWRDHVATGASLGRAAVTERLLDVVRRACHHLGPAEVTGVGFAIPGVLDPVTGTVELLTNFTPDWSGFPLLHALREGSGMPVALLNDVRAATYGEQQFGAGKPFRDFLSIAIGTGIGGGLVLNGELYFGSRGAAGEVGHQTLLPDGPRCNCGNRGCLEALASGYAIARDAARAIAAGSTDLERATGTSHPTPRQVAEAAQAGSETARAIYRAAGTWIGRGLGNLICVLNPEAVVVGGGVAAAGDLLLDPVREEIQRRTVVFSSARGGVQVLPSPLGGDAGAIGAAAWAARAEPALEDAS